MTSKEGVKLDDPKKIFVFTVFATITNVMPKDYFEDDTFISFLVEPSDFKKLKSKLGTSVKMLGKELNKIIEIVVYSDNLELFVKNLVRPANVERVSVRKLPNGKLSVFAKVPAWERGKALGKKSYKLKRSRYFLEKYHNVAVFKVV